MEETMPAAQDRERQKDRADVASPEPARIRIMHERQTEAECLDACNAPPDPALADHVTSRSQKDR
jgi:hypothetical protein